MIHNLLDFSSGYVVLNAFARFLPMFYDPDSTILFLLLSKPGPRAPVVLFNIKMFPVH